MVGFGLHHRSNPSREQHPDANSGSPTEYDHNHAPALRLGSVSDSGHSAAPNQLPSPNRPSNFFSFPLWKKRPPPSPRAPTYLDDTDEVGVMIRPFDSLQHGVDKALPPTPPSSDEDGRLYHEHPTEPIPYDRQPLSTRFPPPHNLLSAKPGFNVPSQPTFALAHAALGLGLPHVMPRASLSSASSDGQLGSVLPEQRHTENRLRNSKSSLALGQGSHSHRESARDPWPSRNLPQGFEDGRLGGKGKGWDAEVELPADVTPPRKPISRRPSFWSRKRAESHKTVSTPPTAPPSPPLLPSTLPSLPPVSPFLMDTSMSSSPSPSFSGSFSPTPALTRRASDKRLGGPPPGSPQSAQPTSSRFIRRPSTATGAPERPRARSLYVDPPSLPAVDIQGPLSALPPPESFPLPPPPEPPSNARRPLIPQPSTPLLRRMSINLFSFGSSSTPSVPSPTAERAMAANAANGHSPQPSPRPSLSKPHLPPPKPNIDEESPDEYLTRLVDAVPKGDVASILASQ